MSGFGLTLENPWLFGAGCALGVVGAALAWRRRPAIHWITSAMSAVAIFLLALAAGGLTWHRPASTDVSVMVDLSASTRGADYRKPAELERRIRQLIGDTPYHITYFAQQNTTAALAGAVLADLPGDKTIYTPPAAVAVILFSDGRFELPSAPPPTFIVADPALDQPVDAAVAGLEMRGPDLAITVRNSGANRSLIVEAAGSQPATTIEPGELTLTRPVRKGATVATAQFNKGDRWPENDVLSLPLAPPMRTQRWWVAGARAAPGEDWVAINPGSLTTDAAAYLAPSVIVLDNLAAADLSEAQLRRLEQYVRDLGGAIVIGGGDRAFSSGLYAGTALEAISPLSSFPPTPAVHWMLLADSSGSMSQAAGNATRWQLAASAITRLLPNLPPDDPVSVGSFAADLNWWTSGKSARETAGMSLPPPGISPSGPTNLEAALERVAREAQGDMPGELLVVSDADTTIQRPDDLAARLKAKKIRLHLLAIGEGRGLEALAKMTAATGGTLRRQLDPKQWAGDVRQLLASAWPVRLIQTATRITFTGDLSGLAARVASPWNRTWLKKQAVELARTEFEGERIAMCGRWTVGAGGEVIACGFVPSPDEVEAVAKLIARPPRDPRFKITWEAGSRLIVRVDARQNEKYLNGLSLRLELSGEGPGDSSSFSVAQTAPGHYEVAAPAPRVRSFATLWHERRVIDRIAVAGRYATEFDSVGNDYDEMRELARRSGGKVIDRSWNKPLELPFPRRELTLTPWLALAGGIILGIGLARWRIG